MNHLARRLAVLLGLGAISLVAIAGPASAHTEADAAAAASGRTKITFTAQAECADGAQPTTGLRVQLPQGASDVQPENQPGWSSQVTATEVKWSAPSPTIDQTTFVVEMVLAQPAGATVDLPTIQGCPNGEEIAWIEIPTSGGTEPAHPAPKIVVPANSTTPSSAAVAPTAESAGPTTTARMSIEPSPITQQGSTTNNAGLVVFIVVCVAIGGGAIILYLRYRNTGNTTPTAAAPTDEVSPGPGPDTSSGPDTPEQ